MKKPTHTIEYNDVLFEYQVLDASFNLSFVIQISDNDSHSIYLEYIHGYESGNKLITTSDGLAYHISWWVKE